MLAWFFVAYGVTLVVTGSKVAAPLRRLFSRTRAGAALVVCPMCVGFWVGLALAYLLPAGAPVAAGPVVGPLACAFASSAACWTWHVVLARMGAESL